MEIKRMMLITGLLVLIMTMLPSTSMLNAIAAQKTEIPTKNDLWDLFIEVYSKIEYLGSKGINVSSLINELNKVIDILNNNTISNIEKAHNILVEINNTCNKLLDKLPNIILWRNVRTYLIATVLASIPILFYILAPRIYIWLWYHFRRKWVLENAV